MPALTAYQIEWNKLHDLLKECPEGTIEDAAKGNSVAFTNLAKVLRVTPNDLQRLWVVWGALETAQNGETNDARA